jgi:hypothetical protein
MLVRRGDGVGRTVPVRITTIRFDADRELRSLGARFGVLKVSSREPFQRLPVISSATPRVAAASYGSAAFSMGATATRPVAGSTTGRGASSDDERVASEQASIAVVSISAEARRLGSESPRDGADEVATTGKPGEVAAPAQGAAPSSEATPVGAEQASGQLSPEEEAKVKDLKQRDRAVRAHEQAHKAVGGNLAGAIHLSLKQGPDGQSYAVEGSVPIDVTPVKDDPQATIRKMQKVQAAAMAPADPSGADQQVAATAAALMANATQDLAKKGAKGANEKEPPAPGSAVHVTG